MTPWSFIVCLHWNYSVIKCQGSAKYTIIKGLNWSVQNKMFQIRPKGFTRQSFIRFNLQNQKNHCWSLQSKTDLKFVSNNYHFLHCASVVQFESDKDWFSLKELSCGLKQSQGRTYDLVKIKNRTCNNIGVISITKSESKETFPSSSNTTYDFVTYDLMKTRMQADHNAHSHTLWLELFLYSGSVVSKNQPCNEKELVFMTLPHQDKSPQNLLHLAHFLRPQLKEDSYCAKLCQFE